MSQKDLTGRLARWFLKLQGFNIKIAYRKGSLNTVADTISRAFMDEIHTPSQISNSNDPLHVDLNSPHFSDSDYVHRMKMVKQSPKSNTNLRVQDNKLYYTSNFGLARLDSDIPSWKLFVPTPMIIDLIRRAHDPPTSAHLGVAKTLEHLQRFYFWPHMAKTITTYIANCNTCKANKPVNKILKPPMGQPFSATRAFQHLYADFLGPYPRTRNGNTCIFIVLDLYSRFVLLQPFRQASANALCKFLENGVFNIFSTPETLLTDNGKQFESKCLKELLTKYGVEHIKTPKYSPQSNASERVNRSILCAIRSYLKDNHREWDEHIQEIASALRNVVHTSTQYSPHFLVFGQHQILHGSAYALIRELDCLNDNTIALNKSDRLTLAQESVLTHLKRAYCRNHNTYNLRSRDRKLTIGQKVHARNFAQSDAASAFAAKLAPKFVEAKVRRLIGNVAVELENMKGEIMGVYHLKDVQS